MPCPSLTPVALLRLTDANLACEDTNSVQLVEVSDFSVNGWYKLTKNQKLRTAGSKQLVKAVEVVISWKKGKQQGKML